MTNTTNITSEMNTTAQIGWLCYDGACQMCTALIRRGKGMLARRDISVVPLQTRWVGRQFGLDAGEAGDEIKLLLADGRVFGGSEAVVELAKRVWWAWPVRWMAKLAVGKKVLDWGYRWVASNRKCINGVCAVEAGVRNEKQQSGKLTAGEKQDSAIRFGDWLPLFVLTAAACLLGKAGGEVIAPWVYMWVIAVSVWAGCKWGTWRYALRHLAKRGVTVPVRRSAAYLLGWPGMDGIGFCDTRVAVNDSVSERRGALTRAVSCMGIGASLVGGAASCQRSERRLVQLGKAGV